MVINLDNDMTLMLNFVEFMIIMRPSPLVLSHIGLFARWVDGWDGNVMVIAIVGCIFGVKDILTLIHPSTFLSKEVLFSTLLFDEWN